MQGTRGRAVAALVVGALALGACGGDDGGGEDAGGGGDDAAAAPEVDAVTVQQVADAAYEVQSLGFDVEITLTDVGQMEGVSPDAPDEAQITATGAADIAADQVQLDIDLTEVMALSDTDAPEATIGVVADGEQAYLNLGALGADYGLDEGQWIGLTVDQLGATTGNLPTQGAGSTNPAAFLDLLRGVGEDADVEVQGEEEVDGVATTHVVATGDVASAVEATPEDRRAAVEQQLNTLGVDQLPVHLWLAEDGVPRRVQVVLEPGQSAAVDGAGLTIDYRLTGIDEPVAIEVPDEGSVIDGSELLGGAGGETTSTTAA